MLIRELAVFNFLPGWETRLSITTTIGGRAILNQAFVFDEKNTRRLEEINDILDVKSKLAYKQAERAEALILKEMNSKDSFISDYEM